MRKTTIRICLVIGSLFLLQSLTAQTLQSPEAAQPEAAQPEAVTNPELIAFAEAYEGVQEIQQDLNESIHELIIASELEPAQFQEIYQAHVAKDMEQIAGFPQRQQQYFKEIMSEIQVVQKDQQELMVDSIDDAGLTVERFNAIIAAIQQDTSLHNKFREIIEN